MTFREKLKKEHPEKVYGSAEGGCEGCPQDYGYVKENCPCMVCAECWDREIPTEIPTEKTYEDGLNDAWELASKITKAKEDGGFSSAEMRGIFESTSPAYVMHRYSYQEALAKLKAYEETQEIKVGDVVQICGLNKTYVVTAIDTDRGEKYYCGIGEKGTWFFQRDVVKTGKHIDIESLLGQIRGE